MRYGFVIAGVAVALGIIGVMTWWSPAEPSSSEVQIQGLPPESQVESVPSSEVAPDVATMAESGVDDMPVEPPPEPQIELPKLAESDDFVRAQVEAWALPESWLKRDDLIARFAVVVQNAAAGNIPRRQLGFMAPTGKFMVSEVGEQLFVDPQSFHRYDPLLEILQAIPPREAAAFIQLTEPLIAEGMALLGDRRPLKELLNQALERVLRLPDLSGPIELEQPKVLYQYADAALEQRSEFDKQILRMGPENVMKLKRYVIEIKEYY